MILKPVSDSPESDQESCLKIRQECGVGFKLKEHMGRVHHLTKTYEYFVQIVLYISRHKEELAYPKLAQISMAISRLICELELRHTHTILLWHTVVFPLRLTGFCC